MGLVVDVRKNLRVCLNLTFIHRGEYFRMISTNQAVSTGAMHPVWLDGIHRKYTSEG